MRTRVVERQQTYLLDGMAGRKDTNDNESYSLCSDDNYLFDNLKFSSFLVLC